MDAESGRPSDGQGEKHVYGISFGIYSLATAYETTRDARALDMAKRAFRWLEEQGWYDPATGTRPEDLTRLFDAFHVPTTSGPATVAGLWDALAAGDKVMVSLDANEIWHPQRDPRRGWSQDWARPEPGRS